MDPITHPARAFLLAISLSALALADAPQDPLQLLSNHKPDTSLSPSTQPTAQAFSRAIERGLDFLEKWQSPNGSWNRIGEIDTFQETDTDLQWRLMDGPHKFGKEYRDGIVKDLPEAKENENVADTALAARAMLNAVVAGQHPEYVPKIKKSIDFLCKQIDTWNGGDKVKTIYIQKRIFDPLHDVTPSLGECRYYDPTIDTFFTLSFLAQARDRLEDETLKARCDRALKILQFKIESTQNAQGTWEDDTDPVARLHDVDSLAPGLTPQKIPRPLVERVSPENMKLPEGVHWRADAYDIDHKNILVHCQYVRDLSIAARLGVPFKTDTLLRAESYLRQNFNESKWEQQDDGPYAKNVCPKAILITSVVAAWYQADLTADYLANHTESQNAALRKHVQDTHAQLQRQVERFLRYNNPPICGPALENLSDCIAAVASFYPTNAKQLARDIGIALLKRQRNEGNFIAGPNDDWRQYEWIGTDRGESIFGTATTLNLLMSLDKPAKQNP